MQRNYDKIPLYLCPVCKHASNGICIARSDIKQAQKICEHFEYDGNAEWIFYADCPACEGGGMLYQDFFGAACMVKDCYFSQKYDCEISIGDNQCGSAACGEREDNLEKGMAERECFEGLAIDLAKAVGEYFGRSVGELSPDNNPLFVALEILHEAEPYVAHKKLG